MQVFHFKKMLREAGKDGVKEMKISKATLEPLAQKYRDALQKMPAVLKVRNAYPRSSVGL